MRTQGGPSMAGVAMVVGILLVAVGALVALVRAPSQQPPEYATVPLAEIEPVPFSHGALDAVRRRYVNDVGLVDYAALSEDTPDLDRYLEQVARVSPHSNLATFPGEAEALAYWLNAYNAHMMRAILDAYPVDSPMDIEPSVFNAQTRTCGGEDLSLNQMEHVIRDEFLDPRIHFVLNCASMSCPWLPQECVDPARLDEQLDHETRRFLAAEEHLMLDEKEGVVYLSAIFNWYEEDFLRWLREVKGVEEPTLLDYVQLYAPPDVAKRIDPGMEVRWQDYDWRLNDANAPWADTRGQFRPPSEGSEQPPPGAD